MGIEHGEYCNCGGTACTGEATYTATYSPPCEHANGWHVLVPFWIFRKRVFVCSDCGEVLPSNAKAVGLDAAGGQSHTSDGLCPGASSEKD